MKPSSKLWRDLTPGHNASVFTLVALRKLGCSKPWRLAATLTPSDKLEWSVRQRGVPMLVKSAACFDNIAKAVKQTRLKD